MLLNAIHVRLLVARDKLYRETSNCFFNYRLRNLHKLIFIIALIWRKPLPLKKAL